jgi:hypothetical protein
MTTQQPTSRRNAFGACLFALVVMLLVSPPPAWPQALRTKVLKACPSCELPPAAPCESKTMHWDRAASWTLDRPIRIHAVSIPEQSEVTLYTDIEVSTANVMYLEDGHIFRVKYAGPGIFLSSPCQRSFAGSNVTTTNITFPQGTGIDLAAGAVVYVHMDVINWTPFTINPMTQDVYIYYSDRTGVSSSAAAK